MNADAMLYSFSENFTLEVGHFALSMGTLFPSHS